MREYPCMLPLLSRSAGWVEVVISGVMVSSVPGDEASDEEGLAGITEGVDCTGVVADCVGVVGDCIGVVAD